MSTKRESGTDAADAQNAPREKRKRVGPSTKKALMMKQIQSAVIRCRSEMVVVKSRSDRVGFEQHRLAEKLVKLKAELAAFKLEVRNDIAKLNNTISMLTCPERHRQEDTTREDAQADEREAMED